MKTIKIIFTSIEYSTPIKDQINRDIDELDYKFPTVLENLYH